MTVMVFRQAMIDHATAANGWHAVIVGSQVGWVSGKYSEITEE